MQRFWDWFWWAVCGCVRGVAHSFYVVRYLGRGRVVPNVQNALLLKSATELAREIRKRKLKSEDVVQAYMARILEVEPFINATVDRCFLSAMEEARKADSLVASGRCTEGELAETKPLLGVPFTVKVLLQVKGLRCTGGSLLYAESRAQEDAPAVALLRAAGAIVLATTNSAELGMDFETSNLLHGRTCNPFDAHRTSGGSSGGESALIGAAGSVIGLGNDLLGSLRVPSHFTGIFAHKPTLGLVPNAGCFPAPDPDVADVLYTGPMCRYAEDLVLTMRVLSARSGMPVNFTEKVHFKNLKICFMKEIHGLLVVPVRQEITRGLKSAVSHLQAYCQADAKEVKMPKLYDATRAILSILLLGVKDLKAMITNGQEDFNEKLDYLKSFFGKSTLSSGPLRALNGSKIPLLCDRKKALKYQKLVESWSEEFDQLLDDHTVLLMPTFPVTAPYHSEIVHFLPSTCYTSIFNVLGLPSTQCPLGYTSDGLPYGIQIVGRKHNDALTIACAIELEKIFGGWKMPGTL